MWVETPNEEIFLGNNLTNLFIDQYYINFTRNGAIGNIPEKLYLLTKFEECIDCPYDQQYPGGEIDGDFRPFPSRPSQKWRIKNETDVICDITPEVGEFGVYTLHIADNECTLQTLLEPVNIYLPIATVLLISMSLAILGFFLRIAINRQRKNKDESPTEEHTKKPRIRSLDTFRGISIVVMVFVNFGGGGYDFLEHAVWNGLQIADLVFPWFMWIMGVCIPMSINSALKRSEKHSTIFMHIIRRSCILFLLGLCLNAPVCFLNNGSIMDNLRIFGVLQRFALCYAFVACLQLTFMKKTSFETKQNLFQDILILLPQWAVVLIILAIHSAITFSAEFDGCTGYLGPGGKHKNFMYMECVGGATGSIDRQVLGTKHVYPYPTIFHYYGSESFDPEGLFGTLTSIVQVFLGVQAGMTLQLYKSHKQRLARWLIWGIVTGIVGGALCGFSKEDGVIPINKNLWSISFVLVTSCFAFILLSACYVLVDILKWWTGKPFLYAGMNALIIYVGHSVCGNRFPLALPLAGRTHFQLLVTATWGTTAWVIVAYWLYKIKFFLSL